LENSGENFSYSSSWLVSEHHDGRNKINTWAQVPDIIGNPIPKLYAAGEAMGGVYGACRLEASR
jgi:fumarate reductase flavoprotein subunit